MVCNNSLKDCLIENAFSIVRATPKEGEVVIKSGSETPYPTIEINTLDRDEIIYLLSKLKLGYMLRTKSDGTLQFIVKKKN